MLSLMSLELNAENMKLFFPSWEKPLSNKEITDFLETPYEKEQRLWYPDWSKDLPRRVLITPATKKYTTKKEIKQDIKLLNDRLDWWLAYKRTAPNEITKNYCDLVLEEYLQKKEKLKKKLRYAGVKFGNDALIRAKEVPISDFLEFNRAGFAK